MRHIAVLFFIPLVYACLVCGCRGDGSEQPDGLVEIAIGTMNGVPAEGGTFEVSCMAEDGSDIMLRPECAAEWVRQLEWDNGVLSFSIGPNVSRAERETVITVTGEGCKDAGLSVVQPEADFQLAVDIDVKEEEDYAVMAHFAPSNDTMTYCTGIMTSDELHRYSDGKSFVEALLERLEAEALEQGIYLTTYLKRSVISGESDTVFRKLQPGMSYSVYAVSLDVMGVSENVVFSREYNTPTSMYPDAVYDIRVTDCTMADIFFEVTPSEPSVPYYTDIISRSEYEQNYGDDNLMVAGIVAETQMIIDYYNGMGLDFSFRDFIRTGKADIHIANLIPDTEYYLYAFGLDGNGVVQTPVSRISQCTEPVTITDDCTFSISFSEVRPTDFDVTVRPSNAGTRYYIQLALSDILNTGTPEELAGMFINMANGNGMDWEDSSQIYTGERTFNTYSDLNYAPFEAGTDYCVFVFGVDSSGERTTEVAFATCRTGTSGLSDMTVSIDVSGIGPSSAYIRCTPSEDDEFYYSYVTAYDSYASFGNDGEFIEYVVEQARADGVLELVRGLYEYSVDGYLLRPDTEYTAFAFGYSGGVTTPLFTRQFKTEKRVFSEASLAISYTVRDGNEIYLQNPSMNYAFENNAAVIFTITPQGSAESWYFSGFGNSLDYMNALGTEELFYSIRTNGRVNYNKTEVMYAVPWNSRLCGAGFAMDDGGREGRPVVIEAVVPDHI